MNLRQFTNREALERHFAAEITARLDAAVAVRGSGSILFSGGSTPLGLLRRLAGSDMDWSAVQVGLVDDRMVPADHDASNARMLRNCLLTPIGTAAPAFLPLVAHPADPERNLAAAQAACQAIGVPDIVVLGMGTDGHFASLFPGDPDSEQALRPDRQEHVVYTTAPTDPRNRISHTWAYLRQARQLYLHITGAAKLSIVETRRGISQSLPIDIVLNDTSVDLIIHWAP